MNQPLDKEEFEKGLAWEDYLDGMGRHQAFVRELYNGAQLSLEERRDFEDAVARHGGRIYLSALTEEWCGDSAVNLPIIARLSSDLPTIEFRVLVRHNHPAVQQAYESEGIDRIPTVSLFDASFREIGRWVERPVAANPPLEKWEADHPELHALESSTDPEDKKRRREIYDGLFQEMAGWYRAGMWEETLGELKKLLLSGELRAAR